MAYYRNKLARMYRKGKGGAQKKKEGELCFGHDQNRDGTSGNHMGDAGSTMQILLSD